MKTIFSSQTASVQTARDCSLVFEERKAVHYLVRGFLPSTRAIVTEAFRRLVKVGPDGSQADSALRGLSLPCSLDCSTQRNEDGSGTCE